MAINRFGKQSRLITVPVTVTIQFWKKTWFVITTWLLSLLLLWWLVWLRIARNRRRQMEKEKLMQKMMELENTALKSQMNPHFIFNCLNSIQQFIFTGDVAASNKYIAGLGKLIRTTLNNSSKPFVYLNDEAEYLSSYLLLEKMRFGEKINYALDIDSSIDPSQVLIPPMLIQPFVENAIKHGLEHKTGSKGFVQIKMQKENDMLVVTVEDNGIGRKAAAAEKTKRHVAFPSKGMSLTEDRISIMNTLYKGTTSVAIIDLNDGTDGATGTRVVIKMPLFEDQILFS
jgi:LytS/YehU family sensor histidine kinase